MTDYTNRSAMRPKPQFCELEEGAPSCARIWLDYNERLARAGKLLLDTEGEFHGEVHHES